MDPVTQCLMGAVTAQVGFRGRIGRDAPWVAAAVTAVSDLDVFAGRLAGALGVPAAGFDNLTFHRGPSHSLLVVPILALPLAAAWWGVRRWWLRRAPPRAGPAGQATGPEGRRSAPAARLPLLYACVLAAMLSHLGLDLCTSYGTQLVWPVARARFAADCMPIIDIFFAPLLAATLLACAVVRKAARGRPGAATAVAWAGFLLALAYVAAGCAMHDRAVGLAVEQARATAGPPRVVRADAYPALASIFVWRTVVETDDEWIVARLRPLAGPGAAPPRREVVPRESSPWIDRARQLPQVRTFEWFARGRARAAHRRRGGEHVAEFHDMRYGPRPESAESLWSLRVTFSEADDLVGIEWASFGPRADRWQMVREAWHDLWSP